MHYLLRKYSDLGVSAEISIFESSGKVNEFQVMLHVHLPVTGFIQQLEPMAAALQKLLSDQDLKGAQIVSARCFLSDNANQQKLASMLFTDKLDCTINFVKQPPLDGSKIALWLQLFTSVQTGNDGLPFYEHNGYQHYHTINYKGYKGTEVNSYHQTLELLEIYESQLKERGCTIENDCIRTWFFMRDVDSDYQGFVEARKKNFFENRLTNDTHYIASTGIEGSTADYKVKVLKEAYAIKGLDEGQVKFLYAKDHLSPTYDYGVTFERGVQVDFGDRRRVYISGTASIDNKGNILFPGDIEGQIRRTWENVEALLSEAECSFSDLSQMIVYLRDTSDYNIVKKMFEDKFPSIPKIIVLAPICRPGWLIEMECIAVKCIKNNRFRDL